MSYFETGFLIGLALGFSHAGAVVIGLWWNDRKWRQRRERLAD